ncbi:2-amino-4-hydroxy-6-hydroxymethyldihydropteridine diphosphokinase [Marinobacterium sediminicola]|uniref:2-amino-4-hydroxy-6-hydroxymethyldihydropteridine diphosphokinase n=1 Tax=Marinobacterium sediminicola TaxID=518898 RepID=A0ABY1RY53_9GAMM|nr:2-amino-4-hydroxy-6-hydroxymethyldihydropteridine diphosphokinase [Marinobacterium sediminicola]ULG68714.1 2-amino-4-hydroxy-6-hydroxymethyldihydropteridine diphosphokinase [Marinobacterium sediminicola]SMR73239.1 2-amino-4-hydroxy-6-hydroxymethyldihydropteridinediphosphokinase [Marinobacterium sediminicola]
MAQVYLSLGSNCERERYICAALDALADRFGELLISSVYESEAVGFDGDNFYNLVVGMETELDVATLSACLKGIEDDNGRDRSGPRFSGRTLDIDILTYGDLKQPEAGVQLPRDEILQNAFVLRPLAEVAPNGRHPVLEQSYAELWQQYDRQQKLWPIDFDWQGQRISRADSAVE